MVYINNFGFSVYNCAMFRSVQSILDANNRPKSEANVKPVTLLPVDVLRRDPRQRSERNEVKHRYWVVVLLWDERNVHTNCG